MSFKISVVTILLNLIINQSTAQYVTLVSNNTSGSQYISDLIQHTNSNYYITGTIDPGSFGNWDIFVSKLDTNNDLLWSKVCGDAYYNQGLNIVELSDSNILITGYSSNPPGNSWTTLIKLNQNGDTLWSRSIFDSTQYIILSYLDNSEDTIKLFGTLATDTTAKGLIVAISSLTGEIFWSKSYQIPGYLRTLFSRGITQKATSKSFILIQTETDSIIILRQAFLSAFDREGSPISVKYLADSCGFNSPILNVSEESGNIFIGFNNFRYSGLLVNYLFCMIDSVGQLRYSKESVAQFGSRTFQSALIIDSTQSVVVASGLKICRLDSTGNMTAINKIYDDPGFPSASGSFSKMISSNNKLITVGSLRNTNNPPVNLLYVKSELDGTGCEILPDSDSTVDVPVAMTNDIINVDTLTSLFSIQGINYNTFNLIFNVACQANIGFDEIVYSNNDYLVYPNPFYNYLKLKGTWKKDDCKIKIYDYLGQVVYNGENLLNNESITIDLNYLRPGLYLISITDNWGITGSKRIIKN